ncbi:hypothetical protein ACHAW6_002225 [Cyclotella cf. meneghiniana]
MNIKTTSLSLLLATSSSEAFTPSPSLIRKSTLHSSLAEDTTQTPERDTKQHLYGLQMLQENDGMSVTIGPDGTVAGRNADALPLPETYITCGKCKCLFAIAEEDLGTRGKGWLVSIVRVKCSVCSNSWYQSRDRLHNIPTSGYEMLPSSKSDLDRIARNLAADHAPDFHGVNKLYVGNLDFDTTQDDLLNFFEDGEGMKVCDVSLVTGPDGRSRGFAFVTFMPGSSLEAALEMNGKECKGRELSVREPNN